MSRLLLVLFACLCLAGCGGSTLPNKVQFSSLNAQGSPTTISAAIYRPSGTGPFPAVVVLHHCGGIDGDLFAWGQRLASLGYVSILPDSFGPRGVARVCATGQVTSPDRIPDAYAAADYLRTLPEVRGDRIGLIGFSHGGGTISALVSRPAASVPFRAAVAYYPGCGASASTVTVPTLILVGAKDDWTPAGPCVAWAARIADPRKLDVVVYPNATHKFDGSGSADVMGGHGVSHHLQPDPGAAADANARAVAFLAQWLK